MNKLASVEKSASLKAEPRAKNEWMPHQASVLLHSALMTITSTLLLGLSPAYSQAKQVPPGTGTKYQTCERVATNFRECKVCDNKEMTVNCKTLWCTDDGTCVDKPYALPPSKRPPIYTPRPPKLQLTFPK